MSCQRCRGLMVMDHLVDMQESGEDHWLRAWRCMNCGEVLEPGIVLRRVVRKSLWAGRIKRSVRAYGAA